MNVNEKIFEKGGLLGTKSVRENRLEQNIISTD